MLHQSPSYSHPITRRQSAFTLSNIADVPKQLTTALTKPISSVHCHNLKHIQSPNDVVNKLLQSFHLRHDHKVTIQFILSFLSFSPCLLSGSTKSLHDLHHAILTKNLNNTKRNSSPTSSSLPILWRNLLIFFIRIIKNPIRAGLRRILPIFCLAPIPVRININIVSIHRSLCYSSSSKNTFIKTHILTK